MYLYRFSLSVLQPGPGGKPYTAILRLKSDGSTILNPPSSAVAPVIGDIPNGSVQEKVFYTGPTPVLAGGTPPVSWSLVAGPQGMTIDAGTGTVEWAGPSVVGSPHTITIRAANAAGTDDESWQLTVSPETPILIAPEIATIADAAATAGTPYSGPAPTLVKGSPPITWSLASGPGGMVIDPATGVVSWPNPTAAGSPHAISIRAANAAGADLEDWRLTVTAPVAAPVIADIPNAALLEGRAYTGPAPVLQQGTPPVTWSLAAGPTGMTIDSATGIVSWGAPVATGSPHTVTIRAANSSGADEESWQLAVSAQVVAPKLGAIENGSAVALKPYTRPAPALTQGTVPVTWSLVSAPSGMVVHPDSGELSWARPTKNGNPHTITLRVANSAGTDEKTWFLAVTNQPPSAPAVNSPANGGQTNLAQPELSVNNSSDPDQHLLTYTFEVFADAGLAQRIASAAGIPQGSATTSWVCNVALADDRTYYWRALAFDGVENSLWMETAAFRVNTANGPPPAPRVSSPADGAAVAVATPSLEVTNAVDPDGDALTYEFEVYSDRGLTALAARETNVVQGANGATAWTVGPALQNGSVYFWRARAADSQAPGAWSAVAEFKVAVKSPPPPPVVRQPVDGAEVATTVVVLGIDNSPDPDGDPVAYFFEVDRVDTFDSPSLQQSVMTDAGAGGRTLWSTAPLADNTLYHWRVKASDGATESSWVKAAFFVNTANDPPSVPTIANPPDRGPVDSVNPSLSVNPAADPDRDALTYEFQLYDSLEGLNLLGSRVLAEPVWFIVLPLKGQDTYYWRARAIDEHGAASGWSELSGFSVNVNRAPGRPGINNPISGGTVASLTPALSVLNALDANDDPLRYEFEVYGDPGLYRFVDKAEVAQQEEITAWNIQAALEDGGIYYWRARATDGALKSSWTPTASFTVATSGTEMVLQIEARADVRLAEPGVKTVRVENPQSPAYGASVELPAGALSEDAKITIGIVKNSPGLPVSVKRLNEKVYSFGPDGMTFAVPVTLRIPFRPEELTPLGLNSPGALKVYTYQPGTAAWKPVPVAAVDEVEGALICLVEHFSMYTAAAPVSGGDDGSASSGGGGGGGGGCFIQATAESQRRNPDRSGLLPWAALAALVFVIIDFSHEANDRSKNRGYGAGK